MTKSPSKTTQRNQGGRDSRSRGGQGGDAPRTEPPSQAGTHMGANSKRRRG